MKLLLHTCCAPCSISCVDSLRTEGIEPDLFWYNPNIQPDTEYEKRKICLAKFADNENLKLEMIDEYGSNNFMYAVKTALSSRCENCYRLRLEKTVHFAAKEGYEAFTTTLLISPYQKHEALIMLGEEMASKHGVFFYYKDFRPLFRKGQAIARRKGMYMQKYCGCADDKEREERINTNCIDRVGLLIGNKGVEKLKNASVIVFGTGGVGSWCAEALVRSGLGKIDIVDFDKVCESNINRQLQATTKTIGQSKVDVLKQRLLEINPDCKITAYNKQFNKESAKDFNIKNADYVIDAIDNLKNKLDLIETVCSSGVPLFSSMGMALKLDPSCIKTSSIWKTNTCPLAQLVRQGLRKRGFTGDFLAVYSDEKPRDNRQDDSLKDQYTSKRINGSLITVTASAGLMLASLVIKDILK